MTVGSDSLEQGGSRGDQRHGGGRILAVDLPRAFPAGDRVADHLRHSMGDMAPPEREYI